MYYPCNMIIFPNNTVLQVPKEATITINHPNGMVEKYFSLFQNGRCTHVVRQELTDIGGPFCWLERDAQQAQPQGQWAQQAQPQGQWAQQAQPSHQAPPPMVVYQMPPPLPDTVPFSGFQQAPTVQSNLPVVPGPEPVLPYRRQGHPLYEPPEEEESDSEPEESDSDLESDN